jgi:hypothetical protein
MTWLVATDDAPSCRLYRLQLQFLARRGRGALVLKDPLHLWHLRPLLELFPDARVIRLHRPVEDVVVSFCGLFMALRFGTTDRMDPAAVGAECVRRIDIWLRRTASARQAACGRVVDVDFRDLVSDPIGVTRRLHRALDRPFTDDAEAAATGWLQTHPSRGRPRPALSDFGLCPGDLEHLRALDQ